MQKAFFLVITCWMCSAIAEQDEKPYKVQVIKSEPQTINVVKTGKLGFHQTTALTVKRQGYLQKLKVTTGDYFSQGQLLASLDVTELKQDKNAKYQQLLFAKQEVVRLQELLSKKLSSQQALDQAKTQVATARAAYKIAYYNLEKAQIIAPFDGVVLKQVSAKDELQQPGLPILQVAAIKNNWVVKLQLTEQALSRVNLGQAARLQLQQQQVAGKVTLIPAQADAVTGLFAIEVTLTNIPKTIRLIAGTIVKVTLTQQLASWVYPVPTSALVSINDNNQAQLFIQQNNGELLLREFTVAQLADDFIYLQAEQGVSQLNVVAQGWQHIKLSN